MSKRVRKAPSDQTSTNWLLDEIYSTLIASGIAQHYATGTAVSTADASSLGTSKTLALALANAFAAHGASTTEHSVADAALAVDAAFASHPAEPADLTEVQNGLNALKGQFNVHIVNATPHRTIGARSGSIAARTLITIADATNQGTANALANELKAAFNRHVAQGLSTIVVD